MKKITVLYRFILIVAAAFFVLPLTAVSKENSDFVETKNLLTPSIVDESPILLESEAEHIRLVEPESVTGYPELQVENNQSLASRFYAAVSQNVQEIKEREIENLDVASSLFEKPLSWNIESGPIEKVHLWAVLQTNMDIDFPENKDSTTKFRQGLVNILMDGKFRGGKEDFLILLDPTPQHTRPFFQPFVKDLFVRSRRIPHHAVTIGHFRPGVGLEGAQSAYTLPFLNRAQISRQFSNIRKFGLRVQGDYSLVDYNFGGYSSDTCFSEFFPGPEFDGWVNFKPLGRTDGKYGKLSLGGGISSGERHDVEYFVAGTGLNYEYKKFKLRAEYASADGSNGNAGLNTLRREGWYTKASYLLTKKLEVLARYDDFDNDKRVAHNNSREYTAGINYYIKGQAFKLVLNYVFCQNQNKPNAHRLLFGTQIAL